MLTYFLITLTVLVVGSLFMAVGVMFANKPLQGSCGGLGKMIGTKCELCGNKDKCQKEETKKQA